MPIFLEDTYICNLCYELIEGRENLNEHYRSYHQRRYLVPNKKPVHVCKSCGSLFLHRRYPGKTPHDYCCQQCYLENANPFSDPQIVATKVLPRLLRGESNVSKRPEVRAAISAKLTGRDAWWLRGDNSPSRRPETRAIIRKNALKRWSNEKWAASLLVQVRNGGLFGWSVESPKHLALKAAASELLASNGYSVEAEVPVKAGKWYVVDVLGCKGSESVVVECGDCLEDKLAALRTVYSRVFHVGYKSKLEEVLVL